tara:strand:+ start:92 stop:1906 length:1815 start_codon:yes stop_codon:yes gene_type:complete
MNKQPETINVFEYLNKRHALKNMTDEDFQTFLPNFVNALYEVGIDEIIDHSLVKCTKEKMLKDWKTLQKKKITSNNISAQCVVGMSVMKKYMKHIYDVRNYKGKSIRNMWTRDVLTKAVQNNRKSHSTPYISEIVRQVGFSGGKTKVTMYRPALTKRIVEHFNAKNVLDVCVGWGGRMLGSLSVENTKYTGIEPCTKTFEGLQNILNELDINNQMVSLNNGKAEDIIPTLEGGYDLALTSPPYYNLELYSDEASQSHNYGDYGQWVESFLKPTVFGVLGKLKDLGHSCWSVKNFKTDKSYNLLDDIIKLHKEKKWKLCEDIEFYVGNNIRPGSAKTGKEVTYVFKKMSEWDIEQELGKITEKTKADDVKDMKKKNAKKKNAKKKNVKKKHSEKKVTEKGKKIKDMIKKYRMNYTMDNVKEDELSDMELLLYEEISERANDVNSSSFREEMTVVISGYTNLGGKLGYDAMKTKDGVEIPVEIKPKNYYGKGKLNGSGNFTDFTHKRVAKYLKDDVTMCVSGFNGGKIMYIYEFDFKHESFLDKIKKDVTKKLPNGDVSGHYCRSAAFTYRNYLDAEVNLVYLSDKIKENKHIFTKPFYDWLIKLK